MSSNSSCLIIPGDKGDKMPSFEEALYKAINKRPNHKHHTYKYYVKQYYMSGAPFKYYPVPPVVEAAIEWWSTSDMSLKEVLVKMTNSTPRPMWIMSVKGKVPFDTEGDMVTIVKSPLMIHTISSYSMFHDEVEWKDPHVNVELSFETYLPLVSNGGYKRSPKFLYLNRATGHKYIMNADIYVDAVKNGLGHIHNKWEIIKTIRGYSLTPR